MLNPHSPKVFKYVTAVQMSVFVILFLVLALNTYYRLDDVNDVVNYFSLIVACANVMYKTFSVTRHSDALWSCMQLTSVEHLSYTYHRKQIMEIGRAKSKSLATFFAILFAASTCTWIVSPLLHYARVIHETGGIENVGDYQRNVLNLVFPVTVRFYNEHFMCYYLLESMLTVIWNHALLIYDIITISMCIAFSYQMKTIFHSCLRVGADTAVHEQLAGKTKCRYQNIIDCIRQDIYSIINAILFMGVRVKCNFQNLGAYKLRATPQIQIVF